MSGPYYPPPFHGVGLPLNDARDLVIKVKYGGTLKRFNACVKGSHFDHNLTALRSKISNAFKFSPNDVFVLTYTDEDGDVVMLDDDDDLRDAAISQKLNPLRIDVLLNSSSRGAKQASDSRSPMSTAMEEQLAQVKSAIDEALKFVPEQLPVVLAKLSHELRSKAASSAPPLADLLDRIAKLITPRSSVQTTSVQPISGATASGSHSSDMQSSKALGLKSVLAVETTPQVGQAPGYTSIEDRVLGSHGGKLIYPRKKRTDAQSKEKSHAQTRGKSVMSSSVPPVPYMAHRVPTLGSATEYERNMYMPFGSYGRTNGDYLRSAAPPPRGPQYCPIPTLESNGKINDELHSVYRPIPTVEPNGKINGEHSVFPPPRGPVYGPGTTPGFNGMFHGGLQTTSMTSPEWNRKVNGGLQTTFPLPPAYDYNPLKFGMHPYGFYQDANPLGSYGLASCAYGSIPQPTVHKWVECDGCGVTPIVGPRYKSIVKDDYDLCSACFSLAGKEAEFTRIDKPMPLSERMRKLDKHLKLQLDCRFIKDLTVPDGTRMAPSTPFRKIWCMRNSGSTAWPFGTQLTWTGGDQFARQSSVKLGISEFGFPVGGEIDVCVDFVAPAKSGRYISYWRLTSPDLLNFGQRVWVLIQVEQPVQTSGRNDTAEIDLNSPADGNSTTSKPSMVEHPVQKSGNKQTAAINLNLPAEGSTTTWTDSSSNSNNDDEDKIDQGDAFLAVLRASKHEGSKAVGSVVPCAPTAVEPVQVPITDPHASSAGAVAMPVGVPSSEAAQPISVHAAPSPDEVFSDMEEKLLRELTAMGFRQVDLNKEVLRQNEYDFQKSVDDLCGYHEWDLVADFKEMGFDDEIDMKETPAKDGGVSIMKVAMDLLPREKDQRWPSCVHLLERAA